MTTLPSACLLIGCKASLILGIAVVLFLIAGRRRPQACALWQRFGVTALLILPVAASLLPTIGIPLLSPETPVVASGIAAAPFLEVGPVAMPAEPLPAERRSAPTPLPVTGISTGSPGAYAGSADRGGPRLSPTAMLLSCLAAAYAAISLFLGFRIVRGWRELIRLQRSSSPVSDPEWRDTLARWVTELRVRRTVQLRMTERASVAMTYGWRSPVILIPMDYLTACDAQQREAVVIHELTHIAHGDFLWRLVTELTASLYWLHPLMWIIRRQDGILRERICDAFCLRYLSRRSYGEALVRIAGRMVARPAASLGMTMAQRSSLRRRLADLASCTPERCVPPNPVQRLFLWATTGIVLALIVVGSLTARAAGQNTSSTMDKKTAATKPKPPASETDQQPNAVAPPSGSLPAKLQGKVVDPQNRPVANARVVVELHRSAPLAKGAASNLPDKWAATTDENGQYSIPTGGQTLGPGDALEITIFADGFPSLSAWIGSRQLASDGSLTQQLHAGRKIRGRLVDPQGGHAVEAVLRFEATSPDLSVMWDSGPLLTGKLGSFSVMIPKAAQASVAVYPRGFAPRFFDIPDEGDDVGPIQLESGTSLTGRVVDKQGRGIAGTVVALQNTEYRLIHAFINLIGTAVTTDEDGNFTLPPVRGKYRVWVTNSAADRSRRMTVNGVQPPPILAQTLVLNGDEKAQEIVLREAESATIRGTVRRADGSPVSGFEVQAHSTPSGQEIGYELGSTRTGDDGRYALRLPVPLAGVSLSTQFALASDGTYQQGKAVGRGKNRDKLYPSMTLDRLTGDVNDVDWVVNGTQPAVEKSLTVFDAPADRELDELGQREEAAGTTYREAAQKASTPEQQMEVFKTLDPRNLFAAEYLAFEQKHRGTTAAVCAMHHVMRGAASVGDPEFPAARARVTLVDVIIEHYLNHEDLDLLLGTFEGGPPVPRAEELLRRAGESPHPHVRAVALLEGAQFQAQKCQSAGTIAVYKRLAPDYPQVRALGERIDQVRKLYAGIDVEACRQKAIDSLDRLLRDYPEVDVPYRVFDAPLMLRFEKRPAPLGNGLEPLADRARNLRFRVAELQLGRPAPELSGESVQGQDVSSRQTLGQVTVLLFSTTHDGRSPALRKELMQLLKDHPDKIAVLEVYASDKGDDAEQMVAAEDILWPVIPEVFQNGTRHKRWSGRAPTILIIDEEGNLRSDANLPVLFLGPCVTSVLKEAR